MSQSILSNNEASTYIIKSLSMSKRKTRKDHVFSKQLLEVDYTMCDREDLETTNLFPFSLLSGAVYSFTFWNASRVYLYFYNLISTAKMSRYMKTSTLKRNRSPSPRHRHQNVRYSRSKSRSRSRSRSSSRERSRNGENHKSSMYVWLLLNQMINNVKKWGNNLTFRSTRLF